MRKRIIRKGRSENVVKKARKYRVLYEGRFDDADGEEFDQGVIDVSAGKGKVISAWEVTLLSGMVVGEKCEITATSDYCYGPDGAGDDIPPNANLYFTMELLQQCEEDEKAVIKRDDEERLAELRTERAAAAAKKAEAKAEKARVAEAAKALAEASIGGLDKDSPPKDQKGTLKALMDKVDKDFIAANNLKGLSGNKLAKMPKKTYCEVWAAFVESKHSEGFVIPKK